MAMNMLEKSELAKQLLASSGGDLNNAIQAIEEIGKTHVQKVYQPKSKDIVVHVEKLCKHYKMGKAQVDALKNVSLDIYKGEFVAITGVSGSGKSTLLQLIGGLDKPDAGIVEVCGRNIARLSDSQLSRFRNIMVGFVFQFFYLQPFLTVQTNIEVPAMFANVSRGDRHTRSAKLAEMVGLGDRLRHLPRELSGGQMQRAAIARALQNNPNVLLADEPTGNLDRANALAVFTLFKKICDEADTTVIVVTHDIELASMADRTIQMADGEV